MEIDAVVEATGFFVSKEASEAHIEAGAKKVLISAPASGKLKTIVYSVNHNTLTSDDQIVSAASCTTNALAPVANILQREFGIVKGFMTTIHAYTGDQGTQDKPHKDLRRARAGAANFVPTSTGAAKAIAKVIPELTGKLDGMAVRGPIITGSLVDLVVELQSKKATPETINQAFQNSASASFGITHDPIVSSDIVGCKHGSLVDGLLTQQLEVDGKKLFKVII